MQEVSRVGAQGVTSKSKLLAREMPDLAGHFVLKMPRDEIVAAMEDVFEVLQRAQEAQPTVRNCFHGCGFDLASDDLAAFHSRINGLSEIAIYKSLLASANFTDFVTVDDGASAHDAHLDAALAD